MWLSGLDFEIAAAFVTFCTALLGAVFSANAWVRVLSNQKDTGCGESPRALYAFTAGSFLSLVGYLLVRSLPTWWTARGGVTAALPYVFWLLLALSGLAAVLVSRKLAARYGGPARRTIEVGSIALLVVYLLGLAGYLWMHLSE